MMSADRARSATFVPTGYKMIHEIDIRNYKCFEQLSIADCHRINVIVGDNGAGKSALLEAIFLALGVTSDLVVRFRQFRGLDGNFRGSMRKIEAALLSDYFYKLDMRRTISINLRGTGPEARSIRISRGLSESLVPLNDTSEAFSTSAIHFHWRDYTGGDHIVVPIIAKSGVQLPETGEDLPDFFFFSSNQTFSSADNADRFSDLSRVNRQAEFVELFTKEYNWIKDLSIESVAGAPAIYAAIDGMEEKIPITSVSSGINRIVTILVAIASRPRSVVLVDEIENGLHHKHHLAFWSALLNFARNYDSQLFLSTHNEEWLDSLANAAGKNFQDIALWRIERENSRPVVRQLREKQAILSIRGGEVR